MAINKCSAVVNTISGLPNQPTLSAEQLKAKFDQNSKNIKDWVNNTFIPELDEKITSLESGKVGADGHTANKVMVTNGDGVVTDGAITTQELSQLSGVTSNIQSQLNTLQGKITYGTAEPSGGSNGDIYIQI